MKKPILALVSFIFSYAIFAQDPSIMWQKTIGGDNYDLVTKLLLTSDGGYLIGGFSPSNASGEKTEDSNGLLDLWIVKTDGNGNMAWQNTIGGSGDDYLIDIEQTPDGGYIVSAGSDSNISGDKTENSKGGLDYWILKLNADGNIIWQKTIGGSQPDFDCYVDITTDGNYYVTGYSDSGVSGDKTEPSNGQRDYWTMKLDASGNILWQNGIGGNLVDRPQGTFQTTDGGYIIAGYSNSNASGDKSENSLGGADYWIVKLNASGIIVWENTIGGNQDDVLRDAIETSDGGILIGGYSKSDVSGDKTENSRGDFDYWILKLDSNGSIIWQKTIGGSGIDYLRDVTETSDGNFIISGYSNSNTSGDKNADSNGGYDDWIVKIDGNNGSILSQNTLGGNLDESGPYTLELPDGTYLIASASASDATGDKTDPTRGLEDYWLINASANLLGTQEISTLSAAVFPNPSNGEFNILLNQVYSNIQVTVLDVLGKEVMNEEYHDQNEIAVKLNSQAGVYFVEVATGSFRKTFKVIIQ